MGDPCPGYRKEVDGEPRDCQGIGNIRIIYKGLYTDAKGAKKRCKPPKPKKKQVEVEVVLKFSILFMSQFSLCVSMSQIPRSSDVTLTIDSRAASSLQIGNHILVFVLALAVLNWRAGMQGMDLTCVRL